MSENTNPTPEQLLKNVTFSLQRGQVVLIPVDPTLKNAGEAADAKAVGDALAALVVVKKVNSVDPDASGNLTLLATQIMMSSESGAQTIAQAIDAAQNITGSEIRRTDEDTQTVEQGISAIETALGTGCTDDEIDDLFEEEEEE